MLHRGARRRRAGDRAAVADARRRSRRRARRRRVRSRSRSASSIEVVTVDEAAIALAILRLIELEKSVVEGAGAAPLAAFLAGKLDALKGKQRRADAVRRQHRPHDARPRDRGGPRHRRPPRALHRVDRRPARRPRAAGRGRSRRPARRSRRSCTTARSPARTCPRCASCASSRRPATTTCASCTRRWRGLRWRSWAKRALLPTRTRR